MRNNNNGKNISLQKRFKISYLLLIGDFTKMKPHHEKAIEKLSESLKEDDKYLALLITGSVAKGEERDDSDIDFILVVTDEEFEKRNRRNRLMITDTQYCDYPGGYVDGKVVNLQYIKTVAERGSESARDVFRDAFIAFTKIPELEEILKKIHIYQKDEKAEKIHSFLAQFEIAYWFIGEAERRKDICLMTRVATDLVLFGGRLILAHNETIYPFHKLFMNALKKAPEKPKNFIGLIETLLKEPNAKNAKIFYESVKNFKKWRMRGFPSIRFLIDTKWAWIDGKPYIGDI